MSSQCVLAGRLEFSGEIYGRLSTANMKFVGWRKIVGCEVVDILTGGGQSFQQSVFQRAMTIVLDDGAFDGHGQSLALVASHLDVPP